MATNNNEKAFWLLVLAALLFFILNQFAFGRLVQWPFYIITTYIHEMGHGLMAILNGGELIRIDVYPNAAGLAQYRGIAPGISAALVAAAGLLAPAIAGGVFILCGRTVRASSRLLLVLSVSMFLSCLFWVRSVFGLAVLLCFAIWLLFLSRRSSGRLQQFLIQFMGVHMLVDTFTRTIRYVFSSSVNVDGQIRASDTGVIADNLGGSYLIWAPIIAILSISILVFSLKRAYFK